MAWDGRPGHINPARFATSGAAHNRQPLGFILEDEEDATFQLQQPLHPDLALAPQPGQSHDAQPLQLQPLSYEELLDARQACSRLRLQRVACLTRQLLRMLRLMCAAGMPPRPRRPAGSMTQAGAAAITTLAALSPPVAASGVYVFASIC